MDRDAAGERSRSALLDHVVEVVSALARPTDRVPERARGAVIFRSGRQAWLEAGRRGEVWADVIESLRVAGRPVYVEIDAATDFIDQVLQPMEYQVARLVSRPDVLEVEFVISHARHRLLRSHPEFTRLVRELEESRRSRTALLVVENDRHEIVDARTASTPVA